jgi:hypothetical protein
LFDLKKLTLQRDGPHTYSSHSDLKSMRVVGNARRSHIVDFYGALIDNGELIICMEALQTSVHQFYPLLQTRVQPTPVLLDKFIRRLAQHVCL